MKKGEPLANWLVATLLCSWWGHTWELWPPTVPRSRQRNRCTNCLRWEDT